jgi:hypothetical protein
MFDRRISKAGRGEAGERLFLIASLVRFADVFAPAKSGVILPHNCAPDVTARCRDDLSGRVFPSLAVVALSVLMRESFREMEVLHQSARRDRFQR